MRRHIVISITTILLSLLPVALLHARERFPESDGQTAAAADNVTATESGIAPNDSIPQQLTINQRRARRGLTDRHTLFVPKGQWIFGGTASYSTHTNSNYRLLIIDDINSRGYTFQLSSMIAYALHDNMAVGARFIYSRSLLKLDNARLKFGDDESGIELSANNLYTLRHSYTTALIWRQYIPLGSNKRFALFNETSLAAGAMQSKFANGMPVKGTYQTGFDLRLGISPGIVAFATNNLAVEVNVGVMGINYSHVKQVHNQVHEGDLKTSMMNFKVNIFSVGLGVSLYL